MRLTEIMCSNQLFGGINIAFFSDFLQLPPAKGNQPFTPDTFLEAKQRFGAIASIDIWKSFHYDKLTINMRQHGDKEYADPLSNVNVGKLTYKQFELLTGRLLTPGTRASVSTICHTYNSFVADGHSPLILLLRTNICDEINTAMLARLGTQAHMLTAIDTLDTVVTSQMMKKVQQAYQKSDDDVTRTAGRETPTALHRLQGDAEAEHERGCWTCQRLCWYSGSPEHVNTAQPSQQCRREVR